MAKTKTKIASNDLAPSGNPWSYGIRTWGANGESHGGFVWDLTPGARITAPDWKPVADCGNGLHCNAWGVEDWSLLGDLSEVATGKRVLGIVRFDPEGAFDLDGKHKAEWMEIVLTTKTADLASILNWLLPKRHAHIQGLTKVQEAAAATTGNYSAAATTGYSSAAATTGKHSIAAALGPNSPAKAGVEGALVLTAWEQQSDYSWALKRGLFAFVGETHGDVTIQPDTFYRLTVDGALEVVEA